MSEPQATGTVGETASAPSGALDGLLSDPATLAKLAGVISALQKNVSEASAPSPTPSANVSPAGAELTDGLSALLSNPALLEKLPQMIAVMKPLLSATAESSTAVPQQSTVPAMVHHPSVDRDNLLHALKPFLSSERRDAVDSILRISKLGEFLKQIK